MPRETKTQRLAREESEKLLREATERETYTQRMMQMLERAMAVNFDLAVSEGSFVLRDRDGSYDTKIVLPVWSVEAEESLYMLGLSVSFKEEKRNEAERLRLLRLNAINKLTDEERVALGI